MSDETNQNKRKRLPPICVRVNEDELKRLEKMSQLTGKSIPEILRNNTLSRVDLEAPLQPREVADEILKQLAPIGNNLNQIAKKINSGLMSGWNQVFNEIYRDWREMKKLYSVNSGIR